MRINTLTFATQILNSNPKKLAGLVGATQKDARELGLSKKKRAVPFAFKEAVIQ
jgi:hypothetical protein